MRLRRGAWQVTCMAEYDYGDEPVAQDQLVLLGQLADKLEAKKNAVDEAERLLKVAQEEYRQVRERELPELMLSIGLKDITTSGGVGVELREEIRASLPKEGAERDRAMAWLKDNDHAGLIKTEISIRLDRTQVEHADVVWQDIISKMELLGIDPDVRRKEDVHHQTLCAFLREEMRQGHEVPLDYFGAFVQKFAEIKKKKK